MAWRKWLVRGLVFSALGAMALGGLAYQAWTNPAAVRRQVLDKLGLRFVNTAVSVESARLRLFGGIAVTDLRLARRDDLDKADFLYVPSAVLYHDKEHLLGGTFGIRKVDLYRPHLRLVRERDGRWNLGDVVAPGPPGERMPTLVVRQGTVVLEDRSAPGAPLLEIKDVCLTAVNDPPLTVTVEGTGQTDVAGPVKFSARVHRATGHLVAEIEALAVPVGPALVQRLAVFCPETAAHLRMLKGAAKLQAALAYSPGAASPLSYDVRCQLSGGEWAHARLPQPLEGIEASLRCVNGRVPLARLTARAGPSRLELTVKDLAVPAPHADCHLDDLAGEIDGRVEHLPVTDRLFACLPDGLKDLKDDYSPAGQATVDYAFRRTAPGRWRKHWSVRPEAMAGEFLHFRYRVEGITGSIDVDTTSEHDSLVSVDLKGRAACGVPVTVTGKVRGEKAAGGIEIDILADNLLLDEKIFRALPPKSQQVVQQFLPRASRERGLAVSPLGRADLKAYVRRAAGARECANRFLITLHDAAVRYDVFPYELGGVTGVLDVLPDHWECRNVRGRHRGGEIRVDGRSFPVPRPEGAPADGRQDRVQVLIQGRDVLLDPEFEQALSPPGLASRETLQRTWQTLALQGRLNFTAEVVDDPGQPQDIDVSVDVRGCSMQPRFFWYALDQVSGLVRYARGRVYLTDVRARHGPAVLNLKSGLIVLKPAGGFTAWFDGIKGSEVAPDADLLRALPPALRDGLGPLKLREPLDVATSLTLDAAEAGGPLKVWWEGGAALRNTALQVGVEAADVTGQVFCRGHYDGQRLGNLGGDVLLEKATLLGQPLANLHARLEVRPDSPDVLRVHDLRADLFGGTVGGEARVEFGPALRYELLVEALQIQLDQFGRHNLGKDAAQAQLQGPMRAGLHVSGEGSDLSGLRGNGRVDVLEGKMGRLPLQVDLLKAFGLRVPDRTAFEQARMLFALEGPQLRIQQLDLFGSAISLRGEGTVNLDGSNVNLDFHADPGRVQQVLPGVLAEVPRAISDQLLKIKMRGRVGKGGEVRFDKELVPAVTEPLKKALGATP